MLILFVASSPLCAMRRLTRLARRPLIRQIQRYHHDDLPQKPQESGQQSVQDFHDMWNTSIDMLLEVNQLSHFIQKLEKDETNQPIIAALGNYARVLSNRLHFNHEKICTILTRIEKDHDEAQKTPRTIALLKAFYRVYDETEDMLPVIKKLTIKGDNPDEASVLKIQHENLTGRINVLKEKITEVIEK